MLRRALRNLEERCLGVPCKRVEAVDLRRGIVETKMRIEMIKEQIASAIFQLNQYINKKK